MQVYTLTTQVQVPAGNAGVNVNYTRAGASYNETPTQVMHVQVGRREVNGVREQQARTRATTTPTQRMPGDPRGNDHILLTHLHVAKVKGLKVGGVVHSHA